MLPCARLPRLCGSMLLRERSSRSQPSWSRFRDKIERLVNALGLTCGRRVVLASLAAGFCLSCDNGVRFPDCATLVAGSFKGFVGDLRPKLLQRPRGRLVRMPFGVVRSPR